MPEIIEQVAITEYDRHTALAVEPHPTKSDVWLVRPMTDWDMGEGTYPGYIEGGGAQVVMSKKAKALAIEEGLPAVMFNQNDVADVTARGEPPAYHVVETAYNYAYWMDDDVEQQTGLETPYRAPSDQEPNVWFNVPGVSDEYDGEW